VHIGQEMVLLRLWAQEGPTHTDLAAALGVEAPTVTKALQRMERAGLVQRRPDADDARVSRVYLTPRGRALEEPVRRAWHDLETAAMTGLTLEERLLLRRLLLQVRDNLS